MIKQLALAAALAVALSGCGQTVPLAPPKIEAPLLKERVPKELLACKAEPDGKRVATSRQAAAYIVDLKAAGRDCRSKLRAVGGVINGEHP